VNAEEFIRSIYPVRSAGQTRGILATLILDGQPVSTGKLYLGEYGAAQFAPEIDSDLDMWPAQGTYLRLFDNGGPLVRVRNLRRCLPLRLNHYHLDFEPLSVPDNVTGQSFPVPNKRTTPSART
jgi:hypothetical protein